MGKLAHHQQRFYVQSALINVRKITYNAKICANNSYSLFERTLKSNAIVEIVNLDIRTQMKSSVTRNTNLLTRNDHLFPQNNLFGLVLH